MFIDVTYRSSLVVYLLLLLASLAYGYPSLALDRRELPSVTGTLRIAQVGRPSLWSIVTVTFVTADISTRTSTYSTSASGTESFFTTTYVATDLQTITTTITTSDTGSADPRCRHSEGETQCGSLCCAAGQFCSSPNQCRIVSKGSPTCENPCGFDKNLCCAANETCITHSAGQAQCAGSDPGVPACSSPCGDVCCGSSEACHSDASTSSCVSTTSPSAPRPCLLSTTVYTVTSSYESTVLETITLVLTRVESGIETVIRTATFQPQPQLCVPELGQVQCGAICCSCGHFCQAPGLCANQGDPPFRPISATTDSTTILIVTPAPTSI